MKGEKEATISIFCNCPHSERKASPNQGSVRVLPPVFREQENGHILRDFFCLERLLNLHVREKALDVATAMLQARGHVPY